MKFVRDLIGKRQCKIRIIGMVHSRTPSVVPASAEHAVHLMDELMPTKYLVETSKSSLELSRFVWESEKYGLKPHEFLNDHSEFLESTALVHANMRPNPIEPIHAIDIDHWRTRMRLVGSMVFHPWESLILTGRFAARDELEVTSSEELGQWRDDFRKLCPNAFRIIMQDRENYMADRIFDEMGEGERLAVLVGVSHVNAVADLVLDKL